MTSLEVNPNRTILVVTPDGVKLLTIGVQGPQGPPGPSSLVAMVVGEVPDGAVNGSNATFTTDFAFVPETVQVFVNGLSQKKVDDFNTSGSQSIQMAVSPETGANLLVNYLRA